MGGTAFSTAKSQPLFLFATLIFVLTGLLVMPLIMGIEGIWLAEFLSFIVCYFLNLL